ncbi:hypothetical protein QTN25_001833 [Entamoeba marina]
MIVVEVVDELNPEVIEQIPNEVNVTNYTNVDNFCEENTILEKGSVEEQQQEPIVLSYLQINEDKEEEVNNVPSQR